MTYVLIGLSLLTLPFILIFLEYGDVRHESLEQWLFNKPLMEIIRVQTIVQFGALLLLFGCYMIFAIWR